ncbi:MAG: pyrroline-5-carboxylate reductase [Betaproteobacteria bacterium]|nr:pyrroline-5-carboxylate reductase [Betaproteobacteria bacterium]
MTITFIGGGNMASAIIGGLAARGFAGRDIKVVEPLADGRERLTRERGVACFAAAKDAAPFGELVVMAVKPQQMREAARAMAGLLSGGELVLSIAAGIRLADLGRWLGGHALIARCMPNTPALIGAGVTAVFAPPAAGDAHRANIAKVLEAVGTVTWVASEALLDPVTAVSGSGPAYVFYFIEALQQAARDMGLDAGQARELSLQTFLGATQLAISTGEDVAVLRERVTSKGGTTERALASMNADRVQEAIVRALKAANERSRELGDLLGRDD